MRCKYSASGVDCFVKKCWERFTKKKATDEKHKKIAAYFNRIETKSLWNRRRTKNETKIMDILSKNRAQHRKTIKTTRNIRAVCVAGKCQRRSIKN